MRFLFLFLFLWTSLTSAQWLLFDSPQCPHCEQLLKAFEAGQTNQVTIFDLGEPANYRRFLTEAKKRGDTDAWPGQMPVLMTTNLILHGQKEILTYLKTGEILSPQTPKKKLSQIRPQSALSIKMFMIGLIDGINPCAFALMIFICAALRLAGRQNKALLSAALIFILSVATTYLLMGWGLLHGLRAGLTSPSIRGTIYLIFALLTFTFAIFSLATIFSNKLIIKVPKKWRRLLQKTIRKNVRFGTGLLMIAGMGVLAAGIESVCTGQVYLPAILIVERQNGNSLAAFTTLIIYNLGFILPLCCVAFGAVAGMRASQLERWGTKQMRWASGLLALLFVVFSVWLLSWALDEFERAKIQAPILTRISNPDIFQTSKSNAIFLVQNSIGPVTQSPLACQTDFNQWYWLFSEYGITVDFWTPRYLSAPIQSILPVNSVRQATLLDHQYTDILKGSILSTNHNEFVGAVAWWIAWQQKYGDKIYQKIPNQGLFQLIYRACLSCGEATGFRLVTSRYGFSSQVTAQQIDRVSKDKFPIVVTWKTEEISHAAVVVKKDKEIYTMIRFMPNSPPIIIENKLPSQTKTWILKNDK